MPPLKRPLKLSVIGSSRVGRTCLLQRYTNEEFPTKYPPTVIDDRTESFQDSRDPNLNTIYNLTLCDYNCCECCDPCFRSVTYAQTNVFLICFDVTNRKSFDGVRNKWIIEARNQWCQDLVILIVGTKVDLRGDMEMKEAYQTTGATRCVSYDKGLFLAEEVGAEMYMECSALTGDGVEDLFSEAKTQAIGHAARQKLLSASKKHGGCVVF